ncbi:MAG: type 1 glutamine amidotransferase, partial [Actinomycetota bacterium]|nr:type 1 glutamine amidotransferase [Actinomycetota bacterium]
MHERNAGPGVFAETARERGWDLDEWFVPAGDEPPADPLGYDALMIFGGAMHADDEAKFSWLAPEKDLLRKLLDTGVPTLGVCLGSQLLAEAAGAPVERAPAPEIGWFRVDVTAEGATDPLLEGLEPDFEAFQWHSYRSPLPPGAVALASNEAGLQAYRIGASAWGIQFHAEVAEV